MNSLLAQYQGILASKGVDAVSYTKQHLKVRIEKHFGETIVFHQPSKTKPEVIYGCTIMMQDILKDWADMQRRKEGENNQGMEREVCRVGFPHHKGAHESQGNFHEAP